MNGNTGCILEVDIFISRAATCFYNNCPLAPEVMNAEANLLSEKQVEIYKLINENNESNDEKAKKLIMILNAKDESILELYNLLNDAVCGETTEDKRKRCDFEIESDERRFMKCVNNPSFKQSHTIEKNLPGVEKQKSK